MSNEAKMSFMDKIAEKILIIAQPLTKLSQKPAMQAIQYGFAATLPLTMFGSLFLIMACAVTGQLGITIFPSLAQYVNVMYTPFNLTTGLIGFYACLTISTAYGKELGLNPVSTVLISAATWFFMSFDALDFSNTTAFSATGAFASMLIAILSVKAYKFLVDHKLTIKLPDMVPPAIANSFIDLIPVFAILFVAWLLKTILHFDITNTVASLLAPIVKGTDSYAGMALNALGSGLFWSVGIHWENMISGVLTPLTATFLPENQAAAAAGVALDSLPHIWCGNSTMPSRACTNYPILVFLLLSKVPGFRQLGVAAAIPAIFCICEPLTFGVPVVMNPYMMIPLILTNIAYPIILWFAWSHKLMNRNVFSAPWASPIFLNQLISCGGDWRVIVWEIVLFVVGLVIYFPFFKAYEKATLKKYEEEKQLEEAQ